LTVDFDALLHRRLFEVFGIGPPTRRRAAARPSPARETLQCEGASCPLRRKGGTFAVGSAMLTVQDDPRSDDPDRHV
jgi:hypothetical protein